MAWQALGDRCIECRIEHRAAPGSGAARAVPRHRERSLITAANALGRRSRVKTEQPPWKLQVVYVMTSVKRYTPSGGAVGYYSEYPFV